jgi:hypothetical protein
MSRIGTSAVAAAVAWTFAVAVIAPYVLGWLGLPWLPALVAAMAGAAGVLAAVRGREFGPGDGVAPLGAWAVVVIGIGLWLAASSWPQVLPPGGGSDLTHHLALVDVLERTGHLVDGEVMGGTLGEMAHYAPGLHLLIVTLGSLLHVAVWRVAHPLIIATVALKAGFVVAAELFVVAGWWALMEWRVAPSPARAALVGACGAATFLVWPIWIGPLMLASGIVVLWPAGQPFETRARSLALATGPVAVVAALHLSRHAAWLRMAGTSGAVPAFLPDAAWWVLVALAVVGVGSSWRAWWGSSRPAPDHASGDRVTLWFFAAVALQAGMLVVVARWRGARSLQPERRGRPLDRRVRPAVYRG